jgi:hypothetical protein
MNLLKPTHKKVTHATSLQNTTITDTPNNTPLPLHHMGLVFDSEITSWIEPLLPLIKSSSNYVQPNGKNIIVEHPLKLIF